MKSRGRGCAAPFACETCQGILKRIEHIVLMRLGGMVNEVGGDVERRKEKQPLARTLVADGSSENAKHRFLFLNPTYRAPQLALQSSCEGLSDAIGNCDRFLGRHVEDFRSLER